MSYEKKKKGAFKQHISLRMAKTSMSVRRKNIQDSFLHTRGLRYFRILLDLGCEEHLTS